MPTYREIRYEVDDPVGLITLDRPDRLNAWTDRMGAEVRHAVARAEADSAVVGVVITGAGRAFCAGADLGTLDAISQAATSGASPAGGSAAPGAPGVAGDGGSDRDGRGELAVRRDPPLPADFAGEYTYLLACPKPIIAAINGPIAGMAVPIALACDLRFMADDAPLVTAFVQRGLIAEWGMSWLLPRLVGPAAALDLLFSSRRVSGTEAAALGLVNAAMPADEVLPHAIAYVEHLAEGSSPTSMAFMKRQVYAQLHAGLGPAEAESQRLMIESFNRPDFTEGVRSYLEKRPPQFGRIGEGALPPP